MKTTFEETFRLFKQGYKIKLDNSIYEMFKDREGYYKNSIFYTNEDYPFTFIEMNKEWEILDYFSPIEKHKETLKKLEEFLDNISQEQIEKYYPKDTTPKGWVSIEEYLPKMFAKDIREGYSVYKVKNVKGNEHITHVSDHNVWYYYAKERGITHWYNE